MNLCISSLAWNNNDRITVYELLKQNNIMCLEIVLSKFSPNPLDESIEFYLQYKQEWESYGLKAISIQSIHFGVEDAFLFGTEKQRQNLLNATKKVIDIASSLEIPNIVFGSPKLRIMSEKGTPDSAIPFFSELNNYARDNNCSVNLEANSSQYSTNFLTTTEEVKNFVRTLNLSNIGINLDLSTMILENENIEEIISHIEDVHHAHISIPFLKTNFVDFSEQIRQYISIYQYACKPIPTLVTSFIPNKFGTYNVDVLSIEMVNQETDLDLIQETITLVQECLQ